MSSTDWLQLTLAVVALAIVVLASWAETCLSAVSRVNVRRLLDERFARADEQAIERTQRLRSAVMLVEVLAVAVTAALVAEVYVEAVDRGGFAVGLLIALGLLIVFGRIIPRVIAGPDPDGDSPSVVRTARMLTALFAPIVRPVEFTIGLFMRREARDVEEAADEHADEPGNGGSAGPEREREEDEIEEDEQEMISGVLHLERATARDLMVPRIDIVALPRDATISEAVEVAIGKGHSRIPVYGRNIDEIVGVVYAKDLLRFVNEDPNGTTVEAIMREPTFYPESKRVDDLLKELQESKIHLAVVVDEYGGTAGVITIEDILEEIVGEIQDEFDPEHRRIEIISEDEAIADGGLTIDDLTDELELEWPEPTSGTIGGFIQRRLGRIPSENEVVQIDGVRLTVLSVEHRRVRQVKIERVHATAPSGLEDESSAVSPSAG